MAVELSNEDGLGSHLSINPGAMVRIEPGTRGFFIAGSNEEIKRAYYYCENCHKDVTDLNDIKKCKCHHGNLPLFFFIQSYNNHLEHLVSIGSSKFFADFLNIFFLCLAIRVFKRNVRAVMGKSIIVVVKTR